MKRCRDCAFLMHVTEKSNYVCSIEKIKHPSSPGLYLKNPNETACMANFRKAERKEKKENDGNN